MPLPQPTTERSDEAQTWALFLLLSAIWGSSFLWIKVGLEDGLAPLSLVTLRTSFAALLLVALLVVRRGRLPLRWLLWKRMIVLGATNLAVPFVLIAWGQQYIPSGMASILNAMVPLFTIVFAAVALSDEHITLGKVSGLGLGFAGVVLLALPNLQAVGEDEDAALAVAGMLAVAAAAVFYAIASVYTRRRLTGMPIIEQPDGSYRAPLPVEISLGSTLMALLMLGSVALVVDGPAGALTLPGSTLGWVGVVWLGALGTGVAYVLFFRIIERWGATRTTLVTYVIPVVAIVLGFIVLGERLRLVELAGAALIIGGVVMVNASVGRRPLFARSRAAVEAEAKAEAAADS